MPVDAGLGDFESALRPLWLRAQPGDDAAYRQCLGLIAARLRGCLNRRLSAHPGEVEDLVQETLLALHLQRGTHDPSLPVSAWSVANARHKLVDLWRRRGRREDFHQDIDDVDDWLLVAVVEEAGTARDLHKLLQQLPDAQRQAILPTKTEGLSVAEAANRTGATESATKVQVHRSLKRLAAWCAAPAATDAGPRDTTRMKTGQLIAMLAHTAGPAPQAVAARRLVPAAAWLAALLSRPAAPAGPAGRARLAAVLVVVVAKPLVGIASLLVQSPGLRVQALLGQSWSKCHRTVLALSLPALAACLWAVRGLAPTHQRQAGFAAGLLAGAVGACGDALACPESSPALVAAWYTLGILMTAGLGAALGGGVLRW